MKKHQFDEDLAEFNHKPVKRAPLRPHAIEEYRAKENFVLCHCGYTGTVPEYEAHNTANTKGQSKDKKSWGMKALDGIAEARFDYHSQGAIVYPQHKQGMK